MSNEGEAAVLQAVIVAAARRLTPSLSVYTRAAEHVCTYIYMSQSGKVSHPPSFDVTSRQSDLNNRTKLIHTRGAPTVRFDSVSPHRLTFVAHLSMTRAAYY